jgi:hypothetical protein
MDFNGDLPVISYGAGWRDVHGMAVHRYGFKPNVIVNSTVNNSWH